MAWFMASIRNLSGDDLGNIPEIMLDVHKGSNAYAAISFGGFLGMGDSSSPHDHAHLDGPHHT